MSRRSVTYRCSRPGCGKTGSKSPGEYNRSKRLGMGLYCSHRCAGLARRKPKPPLAERRAKKAAYDAIRRVQLRDELLAQKREYYRLTHTPEKGRAWRARRKAQGWDHAEYCRRYYSDPKRKAAKVRYDERRRSLIAMHGHRHWAECHRLYVRLCKEIRRRAPDKYERLKARGYEFNKSRNRKREAGCPRAMT